MGKKVGEGKDLGRPSWLCIIWVGGLALAAVGGGHRGLALSTCLC